MLSILCDSPGEVDGINALQDEVIGFHGIRARERRLKQRKRSTYVIAKPDYWIVFGMKTSSGVIFLLVIRYDYLEDIEAIKSYIYLNNITLTVL